MKYRPKYRGPRRVQPIVDSAAGGEVVRESTPDVRICLRRHLGHVRGLRGLGVQTDAGHLTFKPTGAYLDNRLTGLTIATRAMLICTMRQVEVLPRAPRPAFVRLLVGSLRAQ